MEAMAQEDRRTIESWADRVALSTTSPARLLDAGCGPGHWTAHLVRHGHDAEGIDPVPEFIEIARRTHRDMRYRTATFSDIAGDTGPLHDVTSPPPAYDGILAWYSLIHSAPEAVASHLRSFRSVLRPDGHLLIGFFTGPKLAPFDHAVTRAHFWPVAQMAIALRGAGFAVERTEERVDQGARPHAALWARVR